MKLFLLFNILLIKNLKIKNYFIDFKKLKTIL